MGGDGSSDEVKNLIEQMVESRISKVESKVEEIRTQNYLAVQNYGMSRISPKKAPTSKHI